MPPEVLGISTSGARASGTGACGVCTVTTTGAGAARGETRRTRWTGRRGAGARVATIGLRLTDWTCAGRAMSATWSAPPPMIAPPHAQAASFARAIRTDMLSHSS